MSLVTPVSSTLDEGTYLITFPSTITLDARRYTFSVWEDGSANPQRLITVRQDMFLNATYVEVSSMAKVTIFGKVSPVTAGPRSVTVTVTVPTGEHDVLPALTTDANGDYAVSKNYVAGSYVAKVDLAEDPLNKAATASRSFIVGKTNSTVTIDVTVEE